MIENMKELRRTGYLNRDSWKITWKERRRGVHPWRAKPNRLDHLIDHLVKQNKLPAIYFVFGRRRAEYLAWEVVRFDFLTPREKTEARERYRELVARYDLSGEKSAAEMEQLVANGIAFHHAGMLPTLKEVVEQLFTSKLIKLIFTTETFALGINMPARSVIFDELQKFYGTHFGFLTTRDFYQMAGRAGRRGMDEEGFVYIRVHPNDIPFPEVEKILYGKPAQIESQFNTAYATLLNLYRNLGREKLLRIYPSTFHYFQSYKKRRREGADLMERKIQLLAEMGYLAENGLTEKGEFASSIFGYELMLGEMLETLEHLTETELNAFLSSLIFEPRKSDHLPPLKQHHERLKKTAEHHHRQIVRREMKFRVRPHTKPPHFHLAKTAEAWTNGVPFSKLSELTASDEGELVRHFRMIIQLLREIIHAPHASEKMRSTARSAMQKINRGVVDAEKQLRT